MVNFSPDLVCNRTLVKSWTLDQHYLQAYPSCQEISHSNRKIIPCASNQNKGSSTSMLIEKETSHKESSHVTRMTSNPSYSALTETEWEASLDESSTQEESALEQEVYNQLYSSSCHTASLY